MQKRIVSPQNHLFWPVPIKKLTKIQYVVRFNESIKYDLKSRDQHDWNKLCGLNCDLWNQRTEMAMIGFRWYENEIQLAPYYHIKSKEQVRILPKKWISVPINTWIPVRVEIEADRYLVQIQKKLFQQEHGHKKAKGWETPTWFGGTLPAPQDIKIWFKAF